MFCIKSNEILKKTSLQGRSWPVVVVIVVVEISNISFDFVQNMIFIGKNDFLQNEIVKKALVLMALKKQQKTIGFNVEIGARRKTSTGD